MCLALLTFCLLGSLFAQDSHVTTGFDHFYNLEYDQAQAAFHRAIAGRPRDPNLHNHLAQTILYREMFRSGALESELVSGANPFLRRPKMNPSQKDRGQFEESIATAMALANERIAGNAEDVQALYSLGVSYGLRANYNFLVRKAWLDSLRDATTARKFHNKVTKLDSTIVDARLIQGAHDYVVGSLPLLYKILGFVAGFRGDKKKGIATLQLVAREGNLNRDDAGILLCAIYRRERRPEDAVPLLEELIPRFPRNYILRLEMVQMHSDLGNKEEALAVIRDMQELKRSGAPGYADLPAEKIMFSRGTLLFWYRDLDQALEDFKRVTAKTGELDLNTEVLAWLRLGQTHDLLRQRKQAIAAYRHVIRIAPDSARAKQSRRYLRTPYKRKDVS